jgi:CubicO group peptidase (beta-lactamase class C family)
MKRNFWLIIALLLLLLSGCAAPATGDGTPWPTGGWQASRPEAQAMDPAILDAMLAHVEETGLNLHSLLVIRNGFIVLEEYYPPYGKNSRHELYSVTKSFTSTLIGIALDQGLLAGLDQPVEAVFSGVDFANPGSEKEAMRLEDLLTMRSGLDWAEGDSTYMAMYRSPDWVGWVMDLPMAGRPGEAFRYCSGCTHVLMAALEEETEADGLAFARLHLFQPLGIRDFTWELDSRGTPIGGWGLSLTPRDMARLGYLYLRGGRWEDRQVVSADWVRNATRKHTATEGDLGYGYQWWTYPTHSAYTALGRYGQTIFVLPEQDIVVVTTAEIDGHDEIFDLIDNFIIPAVEQ